LLSVPSIAAANSIFGKIGRIAFEESVDTLVDHTNSMPMHGRQTVPEMGMVTSRDLFLI